jgi:YihY family inner membrane protein
VLGFTRHYAAFDRFQQRHPWLGFPLAVIQKFTDDQGGYLATNIAYYGFFSIFPLLLVLTSILGYVLRNDPDLASSIVDSALAQFPVIGPDLQVAGLGANGIAVVIGLVAAIWAGMGVFLASQNAMNRLWAVPHRSRPNFFLARLRALGLLVVLGGSALATTILSTLAAFRSSYPDVSKAAITVASIGVYFLLFWMGFRLLTAEATWRQLRGGAAGAAVLYQGLQTVGGLYVTAVLQRASNTYGTFALVIGLLSWIYLGATIVLFCAEANVVATRRLWPRSFSMLLEQPPTDADVRTLTDLARIEERRHDGTVSVDFTDPPAR